VFFTARQPVANDEPWAAAFFWVVMRLCRRPCGKPLAFRTPLRKRRGFASRGPAAKRVAGRRKARGFPNGRRQSRI